MTICARAEAWPRLAALGLLLLLAGSAAAIVHNVTLISDTGEPVANATVTIVFPDGTQQQQQTNERGVLAFDFPSNGTYVIRYSGGQMSYEVTGAGTGLANAKWVGPAVIGTAFAAAVVATQAQGNDGSPSSGSSGSVDGTYDCSFSQTSNADSHPTATLNGNYNVSSSGSSVSVTHSNGTTNFSASGSLSGNSSTFSGSGTFVGNPGASVSGALNFNSGGASGSLEVICDTCPDTNSNMTADPVQGGMSCSLL